MMRCAGRKEEPDEDGKSRGTSTTTLESFVRMRLSPVRKDLGTTAWLQSLLAAWAPRLIFQGLTQFRSSHSDPNP